MTASGKWISAWADAPTGNDVGASVASRTRFATVPAVIDNMTIREIVKPTVGSRGTIRLSFSNFFGTVPVTLGSVHVGIQTTGAGVKNDVPVTFSGAKSVTIPAGGLLLSDNVTFTYSYGVILAVTEYFSGTNAALTFHEQGLGKVTSYETAENAGDETNDTSGTTFTNTTMNTYIVDRVDVYGDYKETVAVFGSSTTDGFQDNGTGVDQHMSWPEQLADRLHAAGRDDIGIANEGISGNTVAYPDGAAVPVAVPNPEFGEPGFQRFARDVLALPSLGVVIDYLGANDLRIDCDTAASDIIPDKAQFVTEAHAAGVRIFSATTAPSVFCEAENPTGFGSRFPQGFGEEAERFQLVAWEKATTPVLVDSTLEQPSGADGVIDFDAALRDPSNLSYMLPQYDSGDDIHPNDTGYAAMANAVPLSEL